MLPTSNNQKNFTLATYSVMAGAFILSVEKSEAQIIYTDVFPDVTLDATLEQAQRYYLDFDGDGIPEFMFGDEAWMNSYEVAYSAYMKGRGHNDRVAGYQTEFYEAAMALPFGKVIGTSAAFPWIRLIKAQHRDVCLGATWTWGGPYGFQFDNGAHAYMGVLVRLSDGPHFGWIEITTGEDGDFVTIHGYAYESQPGVSIKAGETGDLVPRGATSVDESNVLIYPTLLEDGQLNIQFETSLNTEMQIELINEVGMTVYRKTITTFEGTNHHSLDLSLFPNGNYFVRMRSTDQAVTHRIILQQK